MTENVLKQSQLALFLIGASMFFVNYLHLSFLLLVAMLCWKLIVGIPVLLDWFGHFTMLGYYTFLSIFIDPIISPSIDTFPAKMKFKWKRQLEAWKYGAGLDYTLSASKETKH